jgi:hypothetical protein
VKNLELEEGRMYSFVVGTPADGPFTETRYATDEILARDWVNKNYGEILDEVDWQDEDGAPVVLYVVAGER